MLTTVSTSWAAVGVIVSEDFESYSNTTEMSAVWAGFDGVFMTDIDDDLDGTPEQSGKFAYHPGGSVNTFDLPSSIGATEDEWIQLTVDIYDNDNSILGVSNDNKRMSLGMRAAAGANIIELGFWNNPFGAHHSYRAILFDAPGGTTNPNWAYWDMGTAEYDVNGDGVITPDNGDSVIDPGEEPLDPDGDGTLQPWHNEDDREVNLFSGAKWYTYRVTVKPDSMVFEIDVDYDGTFDFMTEHTDLVASAAGFDQLRFGGPSNSSSGGLGVTFDNIVLEIIEAENAIEGDLNGDGFVGIEDLNIVLAEWNANPPVNPAADPTGDNFVGIEDLNVVLGNWNAGTPPPSVAVPEPATLALLGLGGLAMLKRRR